MEKEKNFKVSRKDIFTALCFISECVGYKKKIKEQMDGKKIERINIKEYKMDNRTLYSFAFDVAEFLGMEVERYKEVLKKKTISNIDLLIILVEIALHKDIPVNEILYLLLDVTLSKVSYSEIFGIFLEILKCKKLNLEDLFYVGSNISEKLGIFDDLDGAIN